MCRGFRTAASLVLVFIYDGEKYGELNKPGWLWQNTGWRTKNRPAVW